MTSRRDSRQKLGEMLAARGKLDRAVLLDALRLQRAHGGRLGTCLLELGAVREDDLLHVLSDQLKLPFLEADDLRSIPDEVVRLVPAKVAVARGAVPVRASGTQLTVAMLDPHDLAGLDEIAFVSGRRIRPHTALELRIQEVLARSYGIDVPTRFVNLLDRLNRARHMWKEEGDSAASDSAFEPGAPPAAAASSSALPSPYPPLPPRPGERPASTASTTSAAPPLSTTPPPKPPVAPPSPIATPPPAVVPPPVVAPPPLPTATAAPPPPSAPAAVGPRETTSPPRAPAAVGVEQSERRLQAPADRDDIADALIEFLRPRVDIGLVMMIRPRVAAGWRAHGVVDREVAEMRIDLAEPSLVHALRDGAPLHRGPLPPLRGNEPLRALLGDGIVDLLALPLRVRDRVVAVVLAASRRSPLAVELVEDLQRLAARASSALELLVLRRKLQKS